MRQKKPDLPPGSHRELSDELHGLHRRAGRPSLRELAKAIGENVAGRTRIHDAFSAPRLPSWGVLSVLVPELARRVPRVDPDAELDRFHQLWDAAALAEDTEDQTWSVVLTDPGGRHVPLIELIRSFTGAGLAEATTMLASLPCTVASGLTRDDAERFGYRVESLGGAVEVTAGAAR